MTMTWACAQPVPALLTAVHSYVPSSALEARGISQLLFPDSLRTHDSRAHTVTLPPVWVPRLTHPLGPRSSNPCQGGRPKSSREA